MHEVTRGAAWVGRALSGNADLVSLLNEGRPQALGAAKLITRYVARRGVDPPYVIFNHMGGPGRVYNAAQQAVWHEQLWSVALVSAPDDAMIEAIMDQIDVALDGKAHEVVLGTEVLDTWRSGDFGAPNEIDEGVVEAHTIAQYTVRVVS